jgi:tetratricopeptide (TPR) repeat protein
MRGSVTPTMQVHCCGASLLAALVSVAAAQQTLPPLPRLAIELFPPSAREAVSRVHRAAVARSTDAAAVGALGRALHAWEQWGGAHEAYARAQALAPRVFEWHYLDALVLERLARHADAAARLEAALAIAPDYGPARVKLADSLFEAGALKDAARLYDALSRDPASEPMGQFGLGRIAAAEGRHEEAVQRLERAVAIFPEWGAAHYALALAYRVLGRRDEAARALARHAQHGARWPVLEDKVAASVAELRDDPRATLQRGVKLAEQNDLGGAIAAHEAALARDPSLAQAHLNLISLYGRTQNWAKAEEHYRAALALGGDVGDAHYDYGVLLGLQGNFDGAAEAYRKALAINPLHARAHNNLGEVLERQRKLDAALEAYRRAVDSQPLFRLARLNVGRMLLALGKPGEAVVELEKIVEPRDVEAPRYQFALAAAYIRAGRKEDGIKWATEARRLALEYGQNELAAAIERDLARLK